MDRAVASALSHEMSQARPRARLVFPRLAGTWSEASSDVSETMESRMPGPYPKGFREGAVALARQGDRSIAEIAAFFARQEIR